MCSADTFRKTYYSHVHSHITYGLLLYLETTTENLDKIKEGS